MSLSPTHSSTPLPSLDTLIGTEITLVTGNDVDSSPALSYSLQLDGSSQGKFGIHRYSGGVSLTAPLDYEDRTWYTLTVMATDSQHQTEANITILVEDVNDNAPVFTHDLYQVTVNQSVHLSISQSINSHVTAFTHNLYQVMINQPINLTINWSTFITPQTPSYY